MIRESSSGTSARATLQVSRVGRVEIRGCRRDRPFPHETLELAVEILHPVERPVAHRIEQRLAFLLAHLDVFARAHGRLQHLDDRHAAAALFRDQPLRDEVAERGRQPAAHGLLIRHLEGADDALDRLRSVDGVQRGEHEVAGLGGGQRDFDRLAIAHLTHQDHLGRLAQRGSERQRERRRVGVQLALVDGPLLVVVQELDRIFDGQDVIGAAGVDQVDDRGERRGFT